MDKSDELQDLREKLSQEEIKTYIYEQFIKKV